MAAQDTGPGRPGIWHAGAVLALLMAFASISTDFYLPAMPAMAGALGAGDGAIEFTITGYLVGLSLGQLVWGPVADRFGRRLPVAAGLGLFILGSAGCAAAQGVPGIVGWRILQALGASAAIVLSRAMVRDLYSGARAAQVMSVLMAVMTVAPVIAPSVGALVSGSFGWRAIFVLLALIGIATLAALFTLPETLRPAERSPSLRLGTAFATYGRLARDPMVMGHAVVVGMFYAGMYGYVAGTPAAFIGHHGVSPQAYGLLFASCVLGITGGNLANARLAARFGPMRCLQAGTAGAAVSSRKAMAARAAMAGSRSRAA
ncbi:Bcr/CflA family efflux MFS transporter [Mangrovicoccus ximenensis]|uniref:Bcr/CflA family efflux MFS transporter n=1 Tax=Mangrovicoccus ximenensis TaxID=1911570 RepID=UPI00191BDE8D|nr:Bcr/CflA family efflux MFS transporter [Mangrovicoccus ximenensis]